MKKMGRVPTLIKLHPIDTATLAEIITEGVMIKSTSVPLQSNDIANSAMFGLPVDLTSDQSHIVYADGSKLYL